MSGTKQTALVLSDKDTSQVTHILRVDAVDSADLVDGTAVRVLLRGGQTVMEHFPTSREAENYIAELWRRWGDE
jgi:hypothetical protein